MTFLAPLWLLGLIPWAAVTLYLLTGRRNRTPVPFIQLWRGPETHARFSFKLEPPPIYLACALAAILLAVLASAGPQLNWPQSGPAITIILDRGITMSARGLQKPRWQELIAAAQPAILSSFGPGPTDLVVIPDGQSPSPAVIRTDRSAWIRRAEQLAPTPIDTQQMLASSVRRALAFSDGPVIVLSDQRLPLADPRLVRIWPRTTPANVGIVAISARESPRPQVMIRLRNDSDLRSATLTVWSDARDAPVFRRLDIDLPPAGHSANTFIDLPAIGRSISASIDSNDDLPADNRAWLVRRQSWPAIEPQGTLPAEVQRIIDIYTRLRPPGDASTRLPVIAGLMVPSSGPAVAVLPDEIPARPLSRGASPRVADHPITARIDWRAVASDAQVAPPPDESWRPLVSAGTQVLLAVRQTPAGRGTPTAKQSGWGPRQVWIGFRSPGFPRSPDFVVFWTDVLDWAGQGHETFSAEPVTALDDAWQRIEPANSGAEPLSPAPGLYRRSDGALRALNAPAPALPQPPAEDWRPQLASIPVPQRPGRPISPLLLLAALALLLLAALAGPKRQIPGAA